MLNKKVVAIGFGLMILFCSCGENTRMKTISELAYNRTGAIDCVYILENDDYVPFLILTEDYGGNTLLVRHDVLDEPRAISDYSSYYGSSEIDSYLNDEYIDCLPDISRQIVISNIEITNEDALGKSEISTETIDRKIFLLSCNEVGIKDSVNIAEEGDELEYFKNPEQRVVYMNGEAYSWWLRTPNTYFLSCTYVLGDNNKIGYTNSYDINGIRPAFCVDGDTPIELTSEIKNGESVYVFSLKK